MTFTEPELWGHQKEALARAAPIPEFGFLFDPGAGKTRATIVTIRVKYSKERRIMSTLILAPKIILKQWKQEWADLSRIPDERVIILTGAVKKRLIQLKEAVNKYGSSLVVITNYEGITQHKTNVANTEMLNYIVKEWKPELLVADESHRCASVKSGRTKSVIRIADITRFRYILTGTFMPNSPEDVWAQFRILDKGQSFGTNYWGFIGKYFYDANAGNPHRDYKDWRPQPGAIAELRSIIAIKTMRVKKEDCIDLPELVCKTIEVELSPEQKKHYNEMKNEMLTYLEDKACVASIALTKALRLMQITSGFMKLDDGTCVAIPNNREAALEDLLMDLRGKKTIVWAIFHENYGQIKRVCEKLKIPYREGHGLVPDKQKDQQIDEFCDDPSVEVLIGNPAAIGIGKNIQAASESIDFSYDFSFEKQEQKYARNYRGGSIDLHSKVTRYRLYCPGTIETTILKAIDFKDATAEQLLSIVKEVL